jgi:hypothetical protein
MKKLSDEQAGKLMMYSGGNPWKTPLNDRKAKMAGLVGATIGGLVTFGLSSPADWPGSLLGAGIAAAVVGGLTYAGFAPARDHSL